jgi:hypothetical protein
MNCRYLNIAKKQFFLNLYILQFCICQLETESNLDLDPELITDPDPKLQIIPGPDPQSCCEEQ